MDEKQSQFRFKGKMPKTPKPESPAATPDPTATKPPSILEQFRGGLNNPFMSHSTWMDLRLSPREWLAKYPDRTIHDWKAWREKQEKKLNWLQRVFRWRLW